MDLPLALLCTNDFNGQVDKWVLGGNISHENFHPNECQAVELLPDANSIFINSRTDWYCKSWCI